MAFDMVSSARQGKYKKNMELEIALKDINSILSSAELKVINEFKKNLFPIIFILGNLRSGSTLLGKFRMLCLSFKHHFTLL